MLFLPASVSFYVMVLLAFAMIVSAFLFYISGRTAPTFSMSLPAFVSGLFCGVLSAAASYALARGGSPASVLLKALQAIELDGLLPLALLFFINLLFFRREAKNPNALSFSGWLVPQYFGCLAAHAPISLFARFWPADPLFCFFYALSAIIAAIHLRSFLSRFWGGGGIARLAAALAFPLVSIALCSVVLSLRFFCMPQLHFAIASSILDLALIVFACILARRA